ncbi:hypothetical protein BDV93DRAFT_601779 [Ceratobasidium sp. AG-I]|nr:hypothetical protein BDV93DRAFT_601779 [Ceratobasidium sp. AG-I]
MHRFRVRTKSDASTKRSVGSVVPAMPSPVPTPPPTLDPLPPASDFRTSLILPSLSRRFTLLRGQNGEPLSIDDVRSRLAQQRANGHANQVTEEEEQIMIDALIRAHSIDPTATSGSDSEGYTTATANEHPSEPASPASKRHSNNMFGSARFRDQSYIRSATRSHADPPPSHLTVAGPRKTALSTPSAPVNLPATPVEDFSFDAYLSDSQLSPAQIRRASLALQDAIQEFDEEGEEDEQILAPRSGPLAVAPQPEPHQDEPHAHHGEGQIGYGEAIAWPSDQSGPVDNSSTATMPYNRLATASPTQRTDTVNRLPGYVPGMHRPITPRDSAVDTDTGGTSTPQPSPVDYTSSPGRPERALPQSILLNKRGSTSNTPLRLRPRQMSTGDSYDHLGGSSSDSTQTPLKSALSDRRRPVSPLVDSAYQSAVRTGTPSNNLMDAWSPTAVSFAVSTPPSRMTSLAGAGSAPPSRDSHFRQASGASTNMETPDGYFSSSPTNGANGTRSPVSPDSPTMNGSSGLANIASSWNGATTNVIVDDRSNTPSRDVGQPMTPPHQSQPLRSPTPTRSPRNGNSTPTRTVTPIQRSTTPNPHRRGHSRSGSAVTESGSGARMGHVHSASGSSTGMRQNPLMMSPMLNSSRSSLASTGSSYHSWDEDQLGGKPAHKRGVSVFIDNDSTPWKKHRSGFDVNLGMEYAPEPEDIREVLAGLTTQDMAAVQEKLVLAAVKKRVPIPAVRPVSGQKRRRASASQSVTSLPSPSEHEATQSFRAVSPPPAPVPSSVIHTPTTDSNAHSFAARPMSKVSNDNATRADALLHAVMYSIESSPTQSSSPPPPQPLAPQTSSSSEEPQSTPPTTTPPSPVITTAAVTPAPDISDAEPLTPDTPVPDQDSRQKALTDALFGSDSDATVKDSRQTFGRSQSLRAFAMPTVEGTPSPKEEEELLVEEVERRAKAATAALKSPSMPRLPDAGTNGRKGVKKLSTRQISSPQLVSATTSVDGFAVNASNQAATATTTLAGVPVTTTPTGGIAPERTPQASKLSQRIKKFTGNLRTRTPNPSGDEISPYVIEAASPATEQSTSATDRQMPSFEPPAPIRTTPATTPVSEEPFPSTPGTPGTPNSAQPRLKGFMARLRKGRKDSTDSRDKTLRAPSPLGPNAKPAAGTVAVPPPPHIPAAMLRSEPIPPPENFSSSSLSVAGSNADSLQHAVAAPGPPPLSAPANLGSHTPIPPQPQSQPQTQTQSHVQSPSLSQSFSHSQAHSQQVDEEALRQLYDAASHLGLDRSAINDILVRSQSTSSRSTALTQVPSPISPSTTDASSTFTSLLPSSTLERAMSVTTPKAARSSAALGRQLSLKPFGSQAARTPSTGPQTVIDENAPQASVVRRTIIFPSAPTRTSSESRRPTTPKQRRRSGSVHSNKSVQDRAPTPPPSRAPANKRFSKDQSPPVPQLPSGLDGTVSSSLQVPRSASAYGNTSNYDSLYEMYAENNGQEPSSGTEAPQNDHQPTGSAVEVLEMSDGQLIWSVVDGLRAAGEDYDEEDNLSFPNRMSRTSEYSMPNTHELRFREHQRTASKSSTISASSKPSKPSPANRPETRVFFSNAGDIGQLIDSLAKSAEAGQFSILPGVPQAPSSSLRPQSGAQSAHSFNSSSYNSSLPDGDWTLEDRIDHMIAASRKRAGL